MELNDSLICIQRVIDCEVFISLILYHGGKSSISFINSQGDLQ